MFHFIGNCYTTMIVVPKALCFLNSCVNGISKSNILKVVRIIVSHEGGPVIA